MASAPLVGRACSRKGDMRMKVYEFMAFLDEITEDERISLMAELTPRMLDSIYWAARTNELVKRGDFSDLPR